MHVMAVVDKSGNWLRNIDIDDENVVTLAKDEMLRAGAPMSNSVDQLGPAMRSGYISRETVKALPNYELNPIAATPTPSGYSVNQLARRTSRAFEFWSSAPETPVVAVPLFNDFPGWNRERHGATVHPQPGEPIRVKGGA